MQAGLRSGRNQPSEERHVAGLRPPPRDGGSACVPPDGKCFFPFHYKNGVFYDCVKFKAKHKWCSLTQNFEGYWKYCSDEDLAKCVFPFWYRRTIYWGCTDDADAFGRKWCSLTQNYNKERVWKFCG
ncbi:hypothetical protein QTO34_010188 [Cnephaeus nilssonii]|uniref:Fibronectin type-II domain-containing protein n=1 Tax=Cnephaeus nilssonii TaxID=3371016 RepID=A0AA40HF02_CNENI|nr:hypothetical protein QTO34_010188 [Eptesicus nilssonii]